jgi:hypothetical protein
VKLEVLQAKVGLDGEEFAGGVHEIAKPTKKLLRAAAMQEKVGAVKVTASKEEREVMRAAVEPDSESERKRLAAMESGEWYEANIRQFLHDVEHGGRETFGADVDAGEYVDGRKGMTDG